MMLNARADRIQPPNGEIRVIIFAAAPEAAEPIRSILTEADITCKVEAEPDALAAALESGPGQPLVLDAGLSADDLGRVAGLLRDRPELGERTIIRLVPPAGQSPEPLPPLSGPLDSAVVLEASGPPETLVSVARGFHRAGARYAAAHRSAEEARAANARLAETDRSRSELLAELAHELRNPLAPIQNAVQVLRLTGARTPILDTHRDIIERQVARMSKLLDDLLEVSRIHRGLVNLQLHPVDVGGVLERAAEASRTSIERRRHRLSVGKPARRLRVLGDEDRLVQAASNLLSYAARHTEEGGAATIEAGREGGRVVIRVRAARAELEDKGPTGGAESEAAASGRELPPDSWDLGLALARDLVMLHGGTIEGRSAGPGEGVEFTIALPPLTEKDAAARREAPAAKAGRAMDRPAGRKILVVDDIVDTADSLAQLLQLLGNETRAAYSGPEALRLVREFEPDMVLLDIAMPGMDGYEAARRIRGNPAGAGIKLVAMTGYGRDIDRLQAREAGFDWHATKPVKLEDLKELLTK